MSSIQQFNDIVDSMNKPIKITVLPSQTNKKRKSLFTPKSPRA